MPSFEMSRIDLRGASLSAAQLRATLPRGGVDVDTVVPKVRPSSTRLPRRGAEAALEYGESFDGVRPETVRVPPPTLRRALAELDPDVRDRARGGDRTHPARCTPTSAAPTPPPSWPPGATVTERWVPVERVGLYVPGGNAVYPSSVVMNVVPAQTAGVDSLVIVSPPQADFGGLPHPTILAAAALLGVDEVWAVGGAQAVALLAYGGTDTDGAELAPGRHDHRARATSTSPPPSASAVRRSASTPRPDPPRSRSWPTTPPTRCTSPPT